MYIYNGRITFILKVFSPFPHSKWNPPSGELCYIVVYVHVHVHVCVLSLSLSLSLSFCLCSVLPPPPRPPPRLVIVVLGKNISAGSCSARHAVVAVGRELYCLEIQTTDLVELRYSTDLNNVKHISTIWLHVHCTHSNNYMYMYTCMYI